jgi:hypothetical protein
MLAPGQHLRLKVSVPIPGHPDFNISYALDAEGPGIAAVAVIGGAVLSLVLLSLHGR